MGGERGLNRRSGGSRGGRNHSDRRRGPAREPYFLNPWNVHKRTGKNDLGFGHKLNTDIRFRVGKQGESSNIMTSHLVNKVNKQLWHRISGEQILEFGIHYSGYTQTQAGAVGGGGNKLEVAKLEQ